MKTLALFLAALVLSVPATAADRIYLTDGSSIDCKIESESLKSVTCKVDGKDKTLPAESILEIEYERKPRLVDEADTSAADGAVADALDTLKIYVDGVLGGNAPKRGQEWAPAYAMARLIELSRSIGDSEGVVEAANQLIKYGTDARQLPSAFLAKANAQMRLGKPDQARVTLNAFETVISEKELSERWRLECRLGQILADTSLQPAAQREKLQQLVTEAGDEYPTVKNRARVSEGESYLAATPPDFDAASKVFKRVVEDPKADDQTLAGAYVGLGDCIFQEAAKLLGERKDATEELKSALKTYMRVVVVYPDEVDYRPKAMFYAGRCYDLMPETEAKAHERAREIFKRLMREYAGSKWAQEAQQFT